jgi:hypothetical protein
MVVYMTGQSLLRIIPVGFVIRRITQVASREAVSTSIFGGIVVGPYHEVVKMTDLLPASAGYFEGHEYRVPANPDGVLSAIFGDYMKLPPMEERHTAHYFDAFNVPLDTYLARLLVAADTHPGSQAAGVSLADATSAQPWLSLQDPE